MYDPFRASTLLTFVFAMSILACSSGRVDLKDRSGLPLAPQTGHPETSANSKGQGKPLAHKCQIPNPPQTSVVRVRFYQAPTNAGKRVKVRITDLISKEDFYFEQSALTPEQELGGLQKLEMLRRFDVNGMVFSYSIFERKAGRESANQKPGDLGRLLPINCLDADGDGEFETAVTDNAELVVPDWAVK
jgi:hypothetical protein